MDDTPTAPAASFLGPLLRKSWLIIGVALLVAAGTYEYYKHKPSVYLAKTQLYLGGGVSAEGGSTGGSGGKTTLSGRALADQVEIINSAVVGLGVRQKLRAEHDTRALRGKAKAAANPNSDFINIQAEAHTPRGAIDLANAFAAVYVNRQRATFLKNVRAAIANARGQLRRIESTSAKGKGTSSSATIQAATLASKINELEAELTNSPGVQQVSPARANPLPISPTPKKNAEYGFVLGLLLAAVAVHLLSRANRRIGSLAEIEAAFNTQILTALPKVRNPVRRPDGTLAPAKPMVEPLRRLHTTLESAGTLGAGVGERPRMLMVMSAEAGDGKSTLVANLARVQRDAGARVAVVEADLRRPVQSRLLGVDEPNRAGLSELLAGAVTLDQALVAVPAPNGDPEGGYGTSDRGSLSLLTCGTSSDNPPALLASEKMRSVLQTLAEDHDHVLIDVPSLLEVGDAIPLLAQVDGIILLARVGHTRDFTAERLLNALARSASAPVLGAVGNCASRKDAERYGFNWAVLKPRSKQKLARR